MRKFWQVNNFIVLWSAIYKDCVYWSINKFLSLSFAEISKKYFQMYFVLTSARRNGYILNLLSKDRGLTKTKCLCLNSYNMVTGLIQYSYSILSIILSWKYMLHCNSHSMSNLSLNYKIQLYVIQQISMTYWVQACKHISLY